MTNYLLLILIALVVTNIFVAWYRARPRYYVRVGDIEAGADTKWELEDLVRQAKIPEPRDIVLD